MAAPLKEAALWFARRARARINARRIAHARRSRPALDVVFERFEISQVRAEIEPFLEELVRPLAPRAILEVGTYRGGTLLLFADVATDDALIASIDLPDEVLPWRRSLYRSFAGRRQRIALIEADSTEEATRRIVERELRGEPLDLLFIDGDHSYDGVARDFELYSPLVRPGGLIAFHDITPGKGAGDVHRLWGELRDRFETREFRASSAGYGIGVLVTPS